MLVGCLVGLAVARPLVFGEDPGMLFGRTDTGNLVFTLLWFILAVGYSGWCAYAGRSFVRPNLAECLLLVVIAATFYSAETAAANRHPARIIAWEWASYLLAFGLARRLAAGPVERVGLLSVVLASAVTLSAYGAYQAWIEFPANQARYAGDPEKLRAAMAEQDLYMDADDPRFELFKKRFEDAHVFGTYAHPNNFAGFLALVTPGLLAAAWLSLQRGPIWQSLLLLVAAGLGLAALWLTHSRGALLGLAVAAAAVAVVVLGRGTWLRQLSAIGVVAALAGAGYFAFASGLFTTALGKDTGTMKVRLEYWQATAKMIQDRPTWGFGPGNFVDAYPRYMNPASAEKIKDPHNFALEVWATAGAAAMFALLATLGLILWRLGQRAGSFSDGMGETAQNSSLPLPAAGNSLVARDLAWDLAAEMPLAPWTFYLGGMFGLLLGFVLRVYDLAPDTIYAETLAALWRSVLWFASFALLWRVAWSPAAFAVALGAGMVALLVNLSVSGGIGFASVATLLWILAGLAFAESAPRGTSTGPVRFAPLLGSLALALVYFLNVYYPIWSAAGHSRAGLVAARKYLDDTQREPNRFAPTTQADLVRRLVVSPLQKAAREDPTNSWNWLQLANWHSVQWTLVPTDGEVARMIRESIQRAEKLDPEGTAPLQARHRMSMRFAEFSQRAAEETEKLRAQADPRTRRQLDGVIADHKAKAVREHLAAVEVLEQAKKRDPHDARLRYQLAESLFTADKASAAFAELREALRLDDLVVQNSPDRPVRSLSDRQRKQIEEWLSDAPAPPTLAPPLPRR